MGIFKKSKPKQPESISDIVGLTEPGVATLIRGVKERDLELRKSGFKTIVEDVLATGRPAGCVLVTQLAFCIETDENLRKAMGTVIKAGDLLSGLRILPGFDRYLGECDSKPVWEFEDRDFTAMANGIRRLLPDSPSLIRGIFGDDIFD